MSAFHPEERVATDLSIHEALEVDVWGTLISDRPYRQTWTKETDINRMLEY